MRLTHPGAATISWGKALQRFADQIKEKSGGRIAINVFTGNQLGGPREQLEQCKTGSVEMAAITQNIWAAFTNRFLVLELPFIIESRENGYKLLDGDYGRQLKEEIAKELSLQILAFFDYGGFRQVMTVPKLVRAPEDLRGLKMRVAQSPIELATFKAWGANATQLDWSQLHTALLQRIVEGDEQAYEVGLGARLHEVIRYVTEINYGFATQVLAVNARTWDGLSPDDRRIFQDAAIEARNWGRSVAAESERSAKAAYQAAGVQIYAPTRADLERWKSPVVPSVWDTFPDKISATSVKAAQMGQR